MSIYFLSRTPSLCVDTSRVGKVYQMVVHKPNEIPHFIREADWISTIVWSSALARQPATSCQCSIQEHCPEHVTWGSNHQRWLVTAPFYCSALHPEDPKCVVWRCGFFFGTFSTRMSIFLRDSLNKDSSEGRNLLLQIPLSYFRKSG